MGDLIVNASLRTIVIVVAALLLVAASGWASTRSLSVHVAGGSGHYNLQPNLVGGPIHASNAQFW